MAITADIPKNNKNQSTIKQKHEHNKSLISGVLDNKIIEKDSIKFSKHAQQRINPEDKN